MQAQHKNLLLKADTPASVSILQSKKQISEIEMAIDGYGENKGSAIRLRNRQISSGVIVDWKQFQESEEVKSQLLVKDAENNEKIIFSYVVQEWFKNQPAKVIYRWIRKSSENLMVKSKSAHLLQQEHIYRGSMKNYRKNGAGVYIIIKKYSDHSQKIKSIKGQWLQDILRTGVMVDQTGKEQILSSNILKIPLRSRKMITPFMEKNQAIEEIRKKSSHLIPSSKQILPVSSHSIAERHQI